MVLTESGKRTEVFVGLLSAMELLVWDSVGACFLLMEFSPFSSMYYFHQFRLGPRLTLRMRFDVPGIFTRDLKVLEDFATEWYADRLAKPIPNVKQLHQYADGTALTCKRNLLGSWYT